MSVDGYNTSYSNAVTGNQTFTITNNLERGIQKYAIGSDGNKLKNNATIDINDLDILNIGGVDYYIMSYTIDIQSYESGQNFVLTDKLPSGFSLVYQELQSINSYVSHHPNFYAPGYGAGYGMGMTSSLENLNSGTSRNFYYSDGVAYFKLDNQCYHLDYEIKIPVETLNQRLAKNDDGVTLTNTVSDEAGTSKTVKVKVKGVPPSNPPEEKGALKKTVNGSLAHDGIIEYSIYVNPGAKDL